MSIYSYDNFKNMQEMLEKYVNKVGQVTDILEEAAKSFTDDLLKLPKPISQIRTAGYTHLIDSFSYRKKEKEIEVVWGKYYGPMVENGTIKMNSKPHFYPLWDKKKRKYIQQMVQNFEI